MAENDIITAPESPGLDSGGSDPGLAAATDALAAQVESPGSAATAPSTPSAPVQEQPAVPAGPDRGKAYKTMQDGYRQRMLAQAAELKRRRQEEDLLNQRVEQQNEILKQAIEAVKTGRPPEQLEPMPDPYTQGPEFAAWLAKQSEATISKLLGPISEAVQRQDQRFAQAEQQRTQQTQQTEAQRVETERLLHYESEYQQAAPELAYGVRERFGTVRDLLTSALTDIGHSHEEAQKRALLHLRTIGRDAELAGENPVAAMDAFGTALVARMSEALGVSFVPVDPGDPLTYDGGNGNGNGYHPAPQQAPTEAERLQAVQRRAAGAGNAAPRVQHRTQATRSETRDLIASGVQDIKQLRAAALRETGGDMTRASMLLNSLTG